ncbi:MAG TPA: CBS domain-containing protein [Alphaproteobacteria bacterium]|nr:CBS domain-containing protein [Alphaproteobacteria bacterium]
MTVELILKLKGTEVVTIAPDMTLEKAARLLSERRIGALVISSNGQSVDGILSERDIVRAMARLGRDALDAPADKAMTRDVVTCSRTDRVEDLMAVMTAKRIRHLPVVEDGVLAGMISIGDVVKSRIEEVELEARSLREYISGY